MEKLENQLQLNVQKQEELDQLLEENRKLKATLSSEKKQLEKKKEQYLEKARQDAESYLEEVQKKADAVLQRVRKQGKTARYHEMIEERKKLNPIEEESADRGSSGYTYKVGDAVELLSSSQVCEIVRIEKKDITILLNGREVRVKKNQIHPSDRHIAHVRQEPSVSYSSSESVFSSMPLECNLIGLHVEEAMEKLDGYMDEAKVRNLKFFRIIHGDGSGALRKAVHKRLTRDPMVKSFRLGAPNEGGTGATIVSMK